MWILRAARQRQASTRYPLAVTLIIVPRASLTLVVLDSSAFSTLSIKFSYFLSELILGENSLRRHLIVSNDVRRRDGRVQ